MLIASLLIQIATNLFNEYYDYKRGLDHEGSVGIGGGIVRDGVKPKTIMKRPLACMEFPLLFGIFICMNSSWIAFLNRTVCYGDRLSLYRRTNPACLYTFWRTCVRLLMGMVYRLNFLFIQTGTVTIEQYFNFHTNYDFSWIN